MLRGCSRDLRGERLVLRGQHALLGLGLGLGVGLGVGLGLGVGVGVGLGLGRPLERERGETGVGETSGYELENRL